MKKKPKFLLLGWDAADWKVIHPLLDKGYMPALESLINRGVMGNVATLDPPLSPMLWTSIATGKYAFKHGVHGFLEGNEDSTMVRPVTSHSIQASTVWQILNKHGYKTNVVGWWPSHPAGPLDGVQVSNVFGKVKDQATFNDWPATKGSVYPKDLDEFINECRVHPGEINIHQLLSFIPEWQLMQKEDTKLVNILASDIAECVSIHTAATYLAENTEWDFMAVYYNAIDHISHVFMKYHPPKMPQVDERRYKLFQQVIEAIYRFHDMMLGRWLELVDEDCHIMILSDHGFHSDHLRPVQLPKEPAAIAREHNYLGMLTLCGPNIKKDETIFGSSLLDVTPTILNIFDIPVGADMDGKVLANAFEQPKTLDAIPTWDSEKPKMKLAVQPDMDKELLDQLADLGYIDKVEKGNNDQINKLLAENTFYVARSFFDAKKYDKALGIMNQLCKDYPDTYRYWIFKSKIQIETKDARSLEETLTVLEKLEDNKPMAHKLLKGELAYLKNDYDAALEIFEELSQKATANQRRINFLLANTFLKLTKYEKALHHFQLTLKANPDNAMALLGVGVVQFNLNNYEASIESILKSIGITYHNASAHYFLGKSLVELGFYQEAINAYELTLHMASGMSLARKELINIYTKHLPNEQRVQDLNDEVKAKSRGQVVIVSGLPRSGTSLMMQMLDAGGMNMFTDKLRTEDIDNPAGYYEHESIKRLAADNSIIINAENKAIKVVAPLIKFLPPSMEYKIIMMKRNLEEIVVSQEIMRSRLNPNSNGKTTFELKEQLEATYDEAVEFAREELNAEVIEVEYTELMDKTDIEIFRISDFLKKELNHGEMKKKVQPQLYRNKT